MHVLIIPVRKYLWSHVLLSRKLKWSRFWQKYSSFGPWVSEAWSSSFFNSVRALPPRMSFDPATGTTTAQLKQQKKSRELASADPMTLFGDNAINTKPRLQATRVVTSWGVWSADLILWSVATPSLHYLDAYYAHSCIIHVIKFTERYRRRQSWQIEGETCWSQEGLARHCPLSKDTRNEWVNYCVR